MQAQIPAPERFQITDEERARVLRTADKVGYVGVVRFRGPRGRRYRPVRTAVCLTLEQAEAAVTDIRGRQYRSGAFPIGHDVYAVDHIGRVVA